MNISKEEARAYIYGMPHSEWRERYQTEATDAQKRPLIKPNINKSPSGGITYNTGYKEITGWMLPNKRQINYANILSGLNGWKKKSPDE